MPARAAGKSERIREPGGKGVILLPKRKNCGCGCTPPGKTSKTNAKAEKVKGPKKSSK